MVIKKAFLSSIFTKMLRNNVKKIHIFNVLETMAITMIKKMMTVIDKSG